MSKRKLQARVVSSGIYDGWDGSHIPQIKQFTSEVPAVAGTEFGYVLHITDGRGEVIDFKIDHPPFMDERGKLAPAFRGEIHVKGNDYEVFLGDAIWEPWQDKCGLWTLTTWHNGIELASQTFVVVPPHAPLDDTEIEELY